MKLKNSIPIEEIPPIKVSEGYKISSEIIDRLLQDSEILIKNKRYSSSIPLSILAFEEFAKMLIFDAKLKHKEGLPISIWDKLSKGGTHDTKLTLYIEARKKILEIDAPKSIDETYSKFSKQIGLSGKVGGKDVDRETKLFQKLLPKLNSIKKKCFYLDYNKTDNDWEYFDGIYKTEFKEALAKFLLLYVKTLSFSFQVFSNLPKKPIDNYSSKEIENIKKLKNVKLLSKLQKRMFSKEYSRYFDMTLLMLFSIDDLYDFFKKSD